MSFHFTPPPVPRRLQQTHFLRFWRRMNVWAEALGLQPLTISQAEALWRLEGH